MNWFFWLLIVILAASTLAKIATVGKPRKPLNSVDMAFATLINMLLIAGIIYYA